MTDLEYKKKMLESVLELNSNIDSFGKSFGEGMKKLDEQADDMLRIATEIKRESSILAKSIQRFLKTNITKNKLEK